MGSGKHCSVGVPGPAATWIPQGRIWLGKPITMQVLPAPPSHYRDGSTLVQRRVFFVLVPLQIKELEMHRSLPVQHLRQNDEDSHNDMLTVLMMTC